MAKSVLNTVINNIGPVTYTVPALKYFLGIVNFSATASGTFEVRVGSVPVITVVNTTPGPIGPIQAASGDVISLVQTAGSAVGISCTLSGFLFDNP